jgi:hypothetical protein
MDMLIICSIIYVFFILSDLVPVYKYEHKKYFWIYVTLMTFSYIASVLISLKVKIPSPSGFIQRIVTAITGQG